MVQRRQLVNIKIYDFYHFIKPSNYDGREIRDGGTTGRIRELPERSSQTLFKDNGVVGADRSEPRQPEKSASTS